MRSEEYSEDRLGFSAEPSEKYSNTKCCYALGFSSADQPGSNYRYVSFAMLYATGSTSSNLDTLAYGFYAIVQPTKPGDVPTTGTARYTGVVSGIFAGDAFATWMNGTARFDFDFSSGSLSGDFSAFMSCGMGCSYDPTSYTFANTQFSRGSTTFGGDLVTQGAPSKGTFSGMFAGPTASELAAQFEAPFYNPEHQGWVTARGTIGAKRD